MHCDFTVAAHITAWIFFLLEALPRTTYERVGPVEPANLPYPWRAFLKSYPSLRVSSKSNL